MNVLSLDLDFFMHGIVHARSDSAAQRPDDQGLVPWSEMEVTNFLDQVLFAPQKAPGKVVSSHHEVFYAWRDAIDKKLLAPPFFVCHVDAHSDLGMGGPSWKYLHGEFLELPLNKRRSPRRGRRGLNFSSFMPFAIGNRWISKIDFIASESWNHDIPAFLLSDKTYRSASAFHKPPMQLEIELMHATTAEINKCVLPQDFKFVRKAVGEPVVPFDLLDAHSVGKRYEGGIGISCSCRTPLVTYQPRPIHYSTLSLGVLILSDLSKHWRYDRLKKLTPGRTRKGR